MSQYKITIDNKLPIISNSKYKLYRLKKKEIDNILNNWESYQAGIAFRSKKEETKTGYHVTSIARKQPPTPMLKALEFEIDSPHLKEALYYGCGRDLVGFKKLKTVYRSCIAYDPYHPDIKIQVEPKGSYDVIHSHYVFNVINRNTAFIELRKIHNLLSVTGELFLSVRNDLHKKDGTAIESPNGHEEWY